MATALLSPEPDNDPFRILPEHTPEEAEAFERDLNLHGIQGTIYTDENGNILDGRFRFGWCERHKINWKNHAQRIVGLSFEQKLGRIIDLNTVGRRGYPDREKSKELCLYLLQGDPEQSDGVISAKLGIPVKTIWRWRKEYLKARLIRRVKKTLGKDGVERQIPEKPKSTIIKSQNAREFRESGEILRGDLSLSAAAYSPKQLRREHKRHKRRQKVAANKHKPMPATAEIFTGDFRELKIEPGTVDLVCCDPIWDKGKFETDWFDAATLAKTWLKPNGFFVCYFGPLTVPPLLRVLYPVFGDAIAMGAAVMPNCNDKLHLCNIMSLWRTIVVWSPIQKASFERMWCDTFVSPAENKADYDWQQPLDVFRWLVRSFADAGDLVVDPFCGSGTTGVAALQMGCRFIGNEIKPDVADMARTRVKTEGKESPPDWSEDQCRFRKGLLGSEEFEE